MRLRAAVLTALAGTAIAVPAAPASAAACSQDGGVSVVVDFASLGGGAQTRCAAGDPTSGVTALRAAGFTPTRAAQQPGYFLCRIDGKPASDPCQRTSPANAYWSYWHAQPGGSWTYSDSGPGDYDPRPGSVEGWAFGAGQPPRQAPPRQAPGPASAAPPTTTAATPPARAAAPTPARSPAVSPGPTPAATRTAAAAAPSADATTTPGSSTAPAGPGPADPAPSVAAAVRGDPASRRPGVGPVVGVLLVAGLATASALQWRRRRRDRA